MTATVLKPGVHLWTWNKRTPAFPKGYPDPAKFAAEARELGAVGVLVHEIGTAAEQLRYLERAKDAFAGLQVTIAVGSRGPSKWESAFADPAIAALNAGFPVMLDWEISWSGAAGQPAATKVVDKVVEQVRDARGRVTDCPWWAPLFYLDRAGKKRPTHPRAPTAIFGKLCTLERYVQPYGASLGDGASLRMLAWSRHPSQYASMGTWPIYPTLQAYRRSLNDQVQALLREPTQLLWQRTELDANCLRALRVVAALRARGFTGAVAVRAFQKAEGLTVDNLVGPQTLRALALT